MKKQIAIAFASAALAFGAPAKQAFTGVVTDTMCGADHKSMGSKDDAACVKGCVKGGSKYALYDGKTVYTLSDQKAPEQYAAKKVTVTGSLDGSGKTIHVESIAPAK